ncbi:MAG: heme-binding domain-containing protein [Winogradskyella arenosi]
MKRIKKIGILFIVVVGLAQFFGPAKNKGDMSSLEPFYKDTNPPAAVKTILNQACMDCHSENTNYPWYSEITPVNYWLDSHVKDGMKHLNLSLWDDYSAKKKDHKLEELIEMVEAKEMPLPSYTWAHSDAKLSEEQIDLVIKWAENVRLKYVLLEDPQ